MHAKKQTYETHLPRLACKLDDLELERSPAISGTPGSLGPDRNDPDGLYLLSSGASQDNDIGYEFVEQVRGES